MAHHGKEGVVKVAGNVAANVTGFTLETSADVVEDSALTNSAKTFVAGRTSFSGSIECHWDEGDTAQEALDVGTSLAFILLPEGNSGGDVSFSGTGLVTGMSIGVTMDGMTSRSVTFQGTGALTQSTV
jgi:hypothetical protein|tara:strand:+ start:158 stop:541 length:384 start_codon:yes stop_codon:yes gene_type:complete